MQLSCIIGIIFTSCCTAPFTFQVMLIKSLLNRLKLCIRRMFMREVPMFGTARGSKDMAVDGAVVECADSTVVHNDLMKKHIIERTDHR